MLVALEKALGVMPVDKVGEEAGTFIFGEIPLVADGACGAVCGCVDACLDAHKGIIPCRAKTFSLFKEF